MQDARTFVVDGSTVSSVPRGASSTLEYDGAHTLAVESSCGDIRADVTIGAEAIDVDRAGLSGRNSGCSVPQATVERSVRKALHGSIGYQIDGNQLRVASEDGALVYTAN